MQQPLFRTFQGVYKTRGTAYRSPLRHVNPAASAGLRKAAHLTAVVALTVLPAILSRLIMTKGYFIVSTNQPSETRPKASAQGHGPLSRQVWAWPFPADATPAGMESMRFFMHASPMPALTRLMVAPPLFPALIACVAEWLAREHSESWPLDVRPHARAWRKDMTRAELSCLKGLLGGKPSGFQGGN